ncbi:replication initiator, partial [Virgisporangium aliadipatigenens]|uniref:replication initiator n=1 Tax=Virgisporangium aliadipatigenens TaxID=741659 RepID=UPI0019416E9A
SMPDGIIYKPCGNRRERICPACSTRYKRDAYQLLRAGLVGGKGVPDTVAAHPAVFPTFTAPSFGPVHTRHVARHTCVKRSRCDCRPEPCHARRDAAWCEHGRRLVCFARHDDSDKALGTPLCLDCYDHPAQVVWNISSSELWRRTTIAIRRYMTRLAKERGVPFHHVVTDTGRTKQVPPFRLSFGKVGEMQRRAVIHFHAIIRLDGLTAADAARTFGPGERPQIVPPPPQLDAADLVAAVDHAAATVGFTTHPHPTNPHGWAIGWGEQVLTRIVTVAADGEVTDGMVAAYLAKYSTKSTEVTGHVSRRLTDESVDLYADPDGTHTERLIEACWILGQPKDWRRLRRWAHMLGFGGHFLTKSRTYSVTFTLLRQQRVAFRRTETAGPQPADGQVPQQPTTLVVNFLQFVGAGWHTTGDALL